MAFFLRQYVNIFMIVVYLASIFLFKLQKTSQAVVSFLIIAVGVTSIVYDYLLTTAVVSYDAVLQILLWVELYFFCLLLSDNNIAEHSVYLLPTAVGIVNELVLGRNPIVEAVAVALYPLICSVFLIVKVAQKRKRPSVLLYLVLSIVACSSVFLSRFDQADDRFALTTILICSVIVFTNFIVFRYSQARIEEEKALQLQKTSITVSQIQPHFLYNSLATIGYICKNDPAKASVAIDKFSDYLRANLNSLKQEKNVPFEEELKHVETYLWLEKLRFEERLNIVYDIGTYDFYLPPLSVQPLVENAVKHGICEKVEGGTLIVRVIDYNQTIKIVIQDDGVGFDVHKRPDDGKIHVGIENVRSRIENMAHGTLAIQSKIGVGTTQTITIPKENGGG